MVRLWLQQFNCHPALAVSLVLAGAFLAAPFGLALEVAAAPEAAAVAPKLEALLEMSSDPGDFAGLGRDYLLPAPPYTYEVFVLSWDESVVVDYFPPDWPADWRKWLLAFSMPGGGPLEPGLYEGVTRWVPAPATGARMWIAGEGRGCNTIDGWFRVHRVDYDGAGQPVRLDIEFEQRCSGATAALRGRLRVGPLPAVTEIPTLSGLGGGLLALLMAAAGLATLARRHG